MKKTGTLISLLLLILSGMAFSCSKSGGDPVDEYVGLLETATKKAEQIKSASDLMNVQEIISPEDAMEIMRNHSTYELTDKDKDKLKKSYDKLLRVAYDKTIEYGGLPEEIKEQTKAQVDLIIDAANKSIDNAKTLGELNGIR